MFSSKCSLESSWRDRQDVDLVDLQDLKRHRSEFENSTKCRRSVSYVCTYIFKISLVLWFALVVQISPMLIFELFPEISDVLKTFHGNNIFREKI